MTQNKVLILLDGSEFRERILPYVLRFLIPEHNKLILFRVAEEPQTMLYLEGSMFNEVFTEQEREMVSEQLREEMKDTKQMLEEVGYSVHREVRFGGVALEIKRFIEQEGIDLVAMTTHGRTGFSKLLYGSIAEHLLHNLTIPILVLRPKKVN